MITRDQVNGFLYDHPAINVAEFTRECDLCPRYFNLTSRIQKAKGLRILVAMKKYGYRGY